MMKTALVLGDIHFPFANEDALDKVHDYAKETQPDLIIQVGDLYDLFAFSKYPRSLNLMTPQHELELGEEKARAMWARFSKDCKRAKRVQLKGNHDARAERRAMESLPSAHSIIAQELRNLLTFPGVQTIFDDKEEYVYDGVIYQHGYRRFGDHARYNLQSTVCGHLHLGGVLYNTNIHGSFFELNVGWLGDKRSPVFDYRCQNRINKTTVGFGEVSPLGPRFICLE